MLKVYQVNSQDREVSHKWTNLRTLPFLAKVSSNYFHKFFNRNSKREELKQNKSIPKLQFVPHTYFTYCSQCKNKLILERIQKNYDIPLNLTTSKNLFSFSFI